MVFNWFSLEFDNYSSVKHAVILDLNCSIHILYEQCHKLFCMAVSEHCSSDSDFIFRVTCFVHRELVVLDDN